jgi:starch synthase
VAYGQLIYGGSDCFLRPSRYEPCGLGQMIAMRYGSIPIVRRTGGLADSVQPHDAAAGSGTGFLFDEASAGATANAIEQAVEACRDRRSWRALQRRAMARDFSWDRAAQEYVAVYERALSVAGEAAR